MNIQHYIWLYDAINIVSLFGVWGCLKSQEKLQKTAKKKKKKNEKKEEDCQRNWKTTVVIGRMTLKIKN